MTIQRKGDELIIKLPKNIDLNGLQRLIDYIEYNQLTNNSKAKQEDADKLSSDVNKNWWAKNKYRLLGE
ncbi:MAG: hypothetical protein IPL55_12470 [Saprospiraceae bacterium]|jgi:hypothetical protein|nr:hypothetical protein [Saprospiraceae bacterium]